MKAAGSAFEAMIALLSFCVSDIGNIEHGLENFVLISLPSIGVALGISLNLSPFSKNIFKFSSGNTSKWC